MTSVEQFALECPPEEQLACFLDGALAPSAVADLEVHLGACDRCCSIVADLANADAMPGDVELVTHDGDLAALEDRLAIGRLGRYTLLERVGAGGMGVVWAAYDTELERRVAIKLLRYDDVGSAHARARRRLVREARAMARVSHPNVIAVHDVVEEDDRVFMTMELVAGRTLGAWLHEGPRPWDEIVRVFIAAGRGLAAAHERGVVHRDFKPDNVLLDDDPRGAHEIGHVRVGDFGLAHTGVEVPTLASGDADNDEIANHTAASHAASFVGTPAYMAPEQYDGGPVDARTDQFAFCIALWEALFGVRPFTGATMVELSVSIREAQVPAPSDRRAVPMRVEQALRRGLARDPDARWPSMDALLRELEAACGRRSRAPWILFALFAVAVVAVVAWPEPTPCGSTPAWIASAWDDARVERIESAAAARSEAASTLASRLTAAIDERAAEMADAFAGSCRAAFVDHTQTHDDHDVRLACLRRSAAAIEVVANFAVDADESGLARALRATAALSGADACEELARVRTDSPWITTASDRSLATELGIAVQQATALRRLGDFTGARERLADALAVSGDPGLGAVAAAAQFELAMIEQREGLPGDRMHEALAQATAAGNDSVVFDALNQLAFAAGTGRHDRSAAEAYAELALAFVGRSRRGDDGRGIVLLNLGHARERTGDLQGAREAFLGAEAAFTAAGTLDAPKNFPLWIALGLVEELTGDLALAETRYEHARARTEDSYGPYHPDVAVALEYLATVRRKRGAFTEALGAAERSLAIRRAVLGPTHPETAVALDSVGHVHAEAGRLDDAEASIGKAVEIWRASGNHGRHLAIADGGLAELQLLRGRPTDGLQRYRAALALAERTLGPEHPELAFLLLGVGACELARGAPRSAVAPLERALGVLQDPEADPMVRAKIELRLAQALVADDPARTRVLVEAARRDAAKSPQSAIAKSILRELDAFGAARP